ncbi:hypothetical protein AHAS_Ahas07G0093800 [Arachis hypogaea]
MINRSQFSLLSSNTKPYRIHLQAPERVPAPATVATDNDNPLEVLIAYSSHRRASTSSWTSLIVVAHAHSLSSAFFCFVSVLSLFLVAQSLLPLILDSDPLIKPWQIPHPIQSMMPFADIFLD